MVFLEAGGPNVFVEYTIDKSIPWNNKPVKATFGYPFRSWTSQITRHAECIGEPEQQLIRLPEDTAAAKQLRAPAISPKD